MDEDVKLSIEQAHEKWITKMVIFGMAMFLATVGFWVHDCNQADEAAGRVKATTCTDAMIKPDNYSSTVKCPDPRQTLTWPDGWTWGKCSCPATSTGGK